MIVEGVAVALVLLAIVACGALAPAVRRAPAPIEEVPSPLRDRRRALLIEIDDLDGARAEGSLAPTEYTAARARVERRLAAVDARLRGEPAPGAPGGPPVRSRAGRATTAVLVFVLVAVVAIPTMLSAAGARAPGQPITGTLPDPATSSAAPSSLAILQAEVRRTPGNIGARLALARAEFDRGQLGEASTQYLAVLKLDPTNAEATARLGLIIGLSGRAAEGVRAIDHAIELDPSYHETLLFRAVLELRVMRRPRAAIRDARAFLDASDGASTVETRAARQLLTRARRLRTVSPPGGGGT